MTITLTPEELYDIVLSCLCDGLYYFSGYGFTLEYDQAEYEISRGKLTNPSREDVQLQMLKDGYGLTFRDEAETTEDSHTVTLNAALINQNYQSIPAKTILTMLEGDYDAGVADECLQYLLYGKLIFC